MRWTSSIVHSTDVVELAMKWANAKLSIIARSSTRSFAVTAPHAVCVTLKNVKNLFAVLCLLLNLHHHHLDSFFILFLRLLFLVHIRFFPLQEILDFLFCFVMAFWNHRLMMFSEQMCYALMYAQATTTTAAAWEHMEHSFDLAFVAGWKLWADLIRQRCFSRLGSSTPTS